MAETTTNVLVAGYRDVESARADFDALAELAADGAVTLEGAILVTHAADGQVAVRQTADHRGRRGAGWGGGVGLAVGLFSPPLLASVAVGAAAGAVTGKFADHRLERDLHERIGEHLPPGSAGIIAVFDDDHRLAVETALAGALALSVVQTDKHGIAALKESLAEAMGKFAPDRTVLPIPDRPFGGTAGRTIDESVPDWSIVMGPRPPAEAPNVLLVLIDDAGFGNPDTFGGPIRTPNLTRVQEAGVTYNRFHVTALCSPTRASILTGRNSHRVGFGSIAEYPGPFPGYTAAKPRSCAALPRVLRDNGYVTSGFGKWHLTPDNVQGAAGPFDHWPQAWGFDRFWGFLSGAAGQYDPIITEDNTIVGVLEGEDGEPGYFPDAMTDKSIEWLHGVRAQDADKPWFMYYSTGCAHAPHHVAKEWADRYAGAFDDGWDRLRERTLERQKALGVVPEDAELTERPDLFPAWDDLSAAEKKLYSRQMEVFAGYSENADWNVGRLLDAIDEMGDLEDTLVIYVWGDNGSSMEGTTTGSFNEMTFLNGVVLDAEQQLELIDQYGGIEALGGDHSAPHFAAAWAHAGNTPFQWGKQMASHLGGTRNPMVVSWPQRMEPSPAMRAQFTHCIDVAPTILEAVPSASFRPARVPADTIAPPIWRPTSWLRCPRARRRAPVQQVRACSERRSPGRTSRAPARGGSRWPLWRASRSSESTTGSPSQIVSPGHQHRMEDARCLRAQRSQQRFLPKTWIERAGSIPRSSGWSRSKRCERAPRSAMTWPTGHSSCTSRPGGRPAPIRKWASSSRTWSPKPRRFALAAWSSRTSRTSSRRMASRPWDRAAAPGSRTARATC